MVYVLWQHHYCIHFSDQRVESVFVHHDENNDLNVDKQYKLPNKANERNMYAENRFIKSSTQD